MDDPARPDPDYGESFADVYDDWYQHVTDVGATAAAVAARASEVAGSERPRVLELGVGSGRLALPIAARGCEVVGIDSSPAMLSLLAAKQEGAAVRAVQGDMAEADRVVEGPFHVVLLAFNTVFNLTSEAAQRRCLGSVASLLAPGGSLLIEVSVPASAPDQVERGLSTTRVDLDRVVLSATEHDPTTQVVTGQHIDITDAGVRLRPWRIRYLSLAQLDGLAAESGLTLVERHADWTGRPFETDDPVAISRFDRPGDAAS